jgi:CPA1 family monovalent cation:H+ antiporter
MLSFLLFAGALHIDLQELKSVKWAVTILATFSVAIATFVTGSLVWLASGLAGLQLPYLYALLFGALISPTDPIAVLSILKEAGLSKKLYVKIGGESLFNDGIGVVVFVTILGLATGSYKADWLNISGLLIKEVLGGAALGFFCGWVVYRLLSSIEDYKVEVLLTLALAAGGYAFAEKLHVSGPICMVVAGLIVGNHGRTLGMSEHTRERLDVFWELLDEILNAVLFMLVGLEVIVIAISGEHVFLGFLSIGAVLLGRYISVGLPIIIGGLSRPPRWKYIGLLTWGGLRGGLSLAMALSLPAGMAKDIILPVTYIVVLFSILIQGLTFKPALKFLIESE